MATIDWVDGGGKLLAHAREMAAGDMAGLVRQHADDLVRRFRSISAPALMKMRRPSATKALNERSLMITTWMFCWERPAAFRSGCV